jgi:hypothetical protein
VKFALNISHRLAWNVIQELVFAPVQKIATL